MSHYCDLDDPVVRSRAQLSRLGQIEIRQVKVRHQGDVEGGADFRLVLARLELVEGVAAGTVKPPSLTLLVEVPAANVV